MQKTKVCHLTTVHPLFDPRIFHKELKTLVKAGYDVTLVAQHDKNETVDGVNIIALPKIDSRVHRMLRLATKAFWLALDQKADIYHFHDPELIPIGIILRILGKKVVYDVHEDYVTAMAEKDYMPKYLRELASIFIKLLENISKPFVISVLAESYYRERFPKGQVLRNYPLWSDMKTVERKRDKIEQDIFRVIYTGNLTEKRGAVVYADLVNCTDNVDVYCIGNCPSELAEKMVRVAGSNSSRLYIEGVDTHVPFDRILEYYSKYNWLAGIALFLPDPHSVRKELTKFYEYMASGLPIIASNFPVWKNLIEGNECGICVDPLNSQEIARAIDYLIKHPDARKQMGENGKRLVLGKYNWEKESEKLITLYNDVLNASV